MKLKNNALESIITSRDFKKFFRDFEKLNVSLNEEMSQETMNISSLPNFVPGEFTVLNFGKLECSKVLREHHSKIQLKITNQWTTELESVNCIGRCPDGTLWMADNVNKVVQHVELEKDNVKVLSRFCIKIFGLIVEIPTKIIVSTFKTSLKSINESTKKVTDSVYNIKPFRACHIHITKDSKIIVVAVSLWQHQRGVIIIMDQIGKRFIEYENDSNNKPLFTDPYKVTSTSNGNIFVIDSLDKHFRGRVVALGQNGNIEGIYTGHHVVNIEGRPFTPIDILATPSDSILIADWMIHVVHILNNGGNFISYYCVNDIGIQYPHSLALSTSGSIYIGSGKFEEGPEKFRAKLYEIKYYGI